MTSWQEFQFIDELKRHNCSFHYVNVLDYPNSSLANDALLDIINTESFDLFITQFDDNDMSINVLKEINKKMPSLLFLINNHEYPFRFKKTCSHYSLVWLTGPELSRFFVKWGAKIIILPYAASPYMKGNTQAQENGVCFIGTPYGYRANMINNLVKNKITTYFTPISTTQKDAYSNHYDYFMAIKSFFKFLIYKEGRAMILSAFINKLNPDHKIKDSQFLMKINYAKPNEIYELYSKYKLCLADTIVYNTGVLKKPYFTVHLKDFEIPMAGGALFCQYFDEINEYFEDGKEAIYYRNKKEMIEKARYYLDERNIGELNAIRKAAREKAEKYHTWWNRFTIIFDRLSIKYDK